MSDHPTTGTSALAIVEHPAVAMPIIMSLSQIEAISQQAKIASYSGFLRSNAPRDEVAQRAADAIHCATGRGSGRCTRSRECRQISNGSYPASGRGMEILFLYLADGDGSPSDREEKLEKSSARNAHLASDFCRAAVPDRDWETNRC